MRPMPPSSVMHLIQRQDAFEILGASTGSSWNGMDPTFTGAVDMCVGLLYRPFAGADSKRTLGEITDSQSRVPCLR